MNEAEEEKAAVENSTEEKRGDAKTASLIGKIVGASEILLGSIAIIVLMGTGRLGTEDAKAAFKMVTLCGAGIAGLFGTVDINLMLEKFSRN